MCGRGRRRGRRKLHLSVSFCSNTLRFVWSRMTFMLTNPPRSSFLLRNIDILLLLCLSVPDFSSVLGCPGLLRSSSSVCDGLAANTAGCSSSGGMDD